MGAHVEIRKGGGSTRIVVAGSFPEGETLRFSIFGGRNGYLTTEGWVQKRRFFCEVTAKEGDIHLPLNTGLSALIPAGTNLVVEEITHNFRASCHWPTLAKPIIAPRHLEAELAQVVTEDVAGKDSTFALEAVNDAPDEVISAPLAVADAQRRVSPWLAGVVGMGIGAAIALAAYWPSKHSAEQPQATVEQVRSKTDAQALAEANTMRSQAEARVRAMQADLSRQRAVHAAELAALAPASQVSDSTAAFTALKVDRAQLEARVAEQEKLIARLRDGVAADAVKDSSREASSLREDLAVTRRDIVRLTDENTALKENSRSQTTIITDFVVKIADQDRLINELRQQLAESQSTAETAKHEDDASWLAIAVDQDGAAATGYYENSQFAASSAALARCRKKGSGCTVVAAYQNTCLALSRPKNQGPLKGNWWFAIDRDWSAAEQKSNRECKLSNGGFDCTVRFTVCSPIILAKP